MPAAGELPRRRVMLIFAGLVLSILVAAMNGTTVTTALPTIAGDLHGVDRISWLMTAYLLGQVVSMPIYGKLGDLFGRKRMLQSALVVFLVGTALAGFAWSMTSLIAFRAAQGLGSGGLIVTAQGIIGDVIPARKRGRYISLLAPMIGVATVVGPSLGGLLIDHVSWRWIFFANLPLVLVALAVTTVTIKFPQNRRKPSIDYVGAVLLGSGVAAVVLVTNWGGTTYPWASGITVGLVVAAALLLTAWVAVERRVVEPIVPLHLFSDRVFVVSIALGVAVGMAMFGAVTYLPTFLQLVSGVSATRSGLLLLPLMGGMMTASFVTGQLMTYTGRYKIFPICGMAAITCGLFLLSTMGVDTPRTFTIAYMAVLGTGIGLVMPVLTTAVQNSVPHGDLGTATSGVNLFRQTGGAIGTALAGTLFTTRLHHQLLTELPPALADRASSQADSITPQAVEQMPPELQRGVVTAVADALPSVYLDFVPVLGAAFVLAWFMKEQPLGTSAAAATSSSPRTQPGVAGSSSPDPQDRDRSLRTATPRPAQPTRVTDAGPIDPLDRHRQPARLGSAGPMPRAADAGDETKSQPKPAPAKSPARPGGAGDRTACARHRAPPTRADEDPRGGCRDNAVDPNQWSGPP